MDWQTVVFVGSDTGASMFALQEVETIARDAIYPPLYILGPTTVLGRHASAIKANLRVRKTLFDVHR